MEQMARQLKSLFEILDKENFEKVSTLLTNDVELADELTGGWLRGRDDVSIYLKRQKGIVTNVQSILSSISTSELSTQSRLSTFFVTQSYLLSGRPHEEEMVGVAIFDSVGEKDFLLRLLHLAPLRPAINL